MTRRVIRTWVYGGPGIIRDCEDDSHTNDTCDCPILPSR